jgi:hypothetical protein
MGVHRRRAWETRRPRLRVMPDRHSAGGMGSGCKDRRTTTMKKSTRSWLIRFVSSLPLLSQRLPNRLLRHPLHHFTTVYAPHRLPFPCDLPFPFSPRSSLPLFRPFFYFSASRARHLRHCTRFLTYSTPQSDEYAEWKKTTLPSHSASGRGPGTGTTPGTATGPIGTMQSEASSLRQTAYEANGIVQVVTGFVQYRAWPIITRFFSPTYHDEAVEESFQKEVSSPLLRPAAFAVY